MLESTKIINSEKREEEDMALILGYQIGYLASDEKLLANSKAVTQFSLGPLLILTSQLISITHHVSTKIDYNI